MHALQLLNTVFGHAGFRGAQEAIVSHVAGRDAVVLLPTGAGKSLCYQVPALVASRSGRGTTVVVSPLIALMHDQVGAMRARGVAAALNSHQDEEQQRLVVSAFLRGDLDILYVSPERAAMAGFSAHARAGADRDGRHRRGALREPVGARLPPRVPAAR